MGELEGGVWKKVRRGVYVCNILKFSPIMIKKAKKSMEQVLFSSFFSPNNVFCLFTTKRLRFFGKMNQNNLFADSHQSTER